MNLDNQSPVINQTSIHIKSYLYDRIKEVAQDYTKDKNGGTESPYLSDFEKKVLLLCEVPEDYKGEKVCINATT